MVGRKVCPLGARKLLHHFLKVIFVHGAAHIGVLFLRRRQRHHIGLVDLPANVSRAVHTFARERRLRKQPFDLAIQPKGILGGVAPAVTLARLIFSIHGFAKENLVPVRRRGLYQAPVLHPASHRAFFGQIGFDVYPCAVVAGVENNDLAAAVNVPVAAVISLLFNATVVTLWYTDFAHSPMELEGSIAEKRLKRAKQLARTGTFVAHIDHEVFKNMTREQLEGVAARAWRRAQDQPNATLEGNGDGEAETRIRVRTNDVAAMRRNLEPRLEGNVKGWRLISLAPKSDGSEVVEYAVLIKKKTSPEDLLILVRAAGAPHVTEAELV